MTKSKLSTYVLLDRSGSMSGSKWENAIGSINSYVTELKKDKDISGDVTVAAFDGSGLNTWNVSGSLSRANLGRSAVDFTVLRENQSLDKFKQIGIDEVTPRGSTPLFDATATLLNMAETDPSEKTMIIIMTDGEENASQEYNLTSIKDRLATCTKRGWEVVFLGAEFNADRVAMNLGLDISKVVNNKATETIDTMRFYAASSMAYAKTGASINTSARRSEVGNDGTK